MTFILILLVAIVSISQSPVVGQDKQDGTDSIVCTILYNNTSASDSIVADHGFSCLVESGNQTCLFDTGRLSDKFMINASQLQVDFSGIDQVFVSHIHDDHTGALFDVLGKCNNPGLYLPFSYPHMEGEVLGEEADKDYRAMLDSLRPFVSEIVETKEPVKIGDDLYSTGIIEDQTYEHALIVPTSRGLIIITGCAHPGILEIVRHAKELMKQDAYLVMGGFHLIRADSTEAMTIAQTLRTMTKYVGPCHCTGETAMESLRDVFEDDYIDIQAGSKLKLNEGKLQ